MFISDVIAGLTVGLMVVPQALAYASIAGLPLQYGLYSSFMGVFVYTFFGTSKDVTLGPTAILSLLTASVINSNANENNLEANVPMAVLLTLLSGLIQFTLGILNLGFLIEFIPLPVISGFTSAAAITIAMGQVQHLLGIHGTNITVRRPFIYCLYDTARYITHWKKLGVGVIVAPLIGFLESIAIGKAFARQNKYSINPTQELIAIGLSNVASCFVGSYPVTGSFSRYIPKTALSAIIIAAVLYMVDIRIVYKIWTIRSQPITAVVFNCSAMPDIDYTIIQITLVMPQLLSQGGSVKSLKRQTLLGLASGNLKLSWNSLLCIVVSRRFTGFYRNETLRMRVINSVMRPFNLGMKPLDLGMRLVNSGKSKNETLRMRVINSVMRPFNLGMKPLDLGMRLLNSGKSKNETLIMR
ncbi:LOW QUALITY PROTEIN: sodium-independent sulfate anion transporter-like, partial [Gigantopelta aegis]|uniref:LOW QUALITY PROTEIN: sodium-independent sulfate anion transporter-like n=1 Tax=Gigantopelta aegis TaxID=1735272 RepID=UPI001B88BF17